MDHGHFASITTRVVSRSRRRALATLALLGAGLVVSKGQDASARKRRRHGRGKKVVRQCKCSTCATCEQGHCVSLPEGAACALGVCREGVCIAE